MISPTRTTAIPTLALLFAAASFTAAAADEPATVKFSKRKLFVSPYESCDVGDITSGIQDFGFDSNEITLSGSGEVLPASGDQADVVMILQDTEGSQTTRRIARISFSGGGSKLVWQSDPVDDSASRVEVAMVGDTLFAGIEDQLYALDPATGKTRWSTTLRDKLEVRCAYGAPWRVAWDRSAVHEIPYHVVLRGRVVIEDPESGAVRKLVGGDIVLLPSGAPHVLHDGSGTAPAPTQEHLTSAGWVVSENGSEGEPLDMLCGRFLIGPPHDRLMRSYLPTNLVVHAAEAGPETGVSPTASAQLASLIDMMRMESTGDKAGGYAILNALSSALFALVLRAASETDQAPEGLLALVDGKFMTFRVPYPMGFYAKGIDGRIDDPKGGWKGKGIWTTYATRAPFHVEGGKGTTSKLVKFQVRNTPLDK